MLVKKTFPYNWTWVQSLLFGAIFSATDPVAVVAVLKEVGLCTKEVCIEGLSINFCKLQCIQIEH